MLCCVVFAWFFFSPFRSLRIYDDTIRFLSLIGYDETVTNNIGYYLDCKTYFDVSVLGLVASAVHVSSGATMPFSMCCAGVVRFAVCSVLTL